VLLPPPKNHPLTLTQLPSAQKISIINYRCCVPCFVLFSFKEHENERRKMAKFMEKEQQQLRKESISIFWQPHLPLFLFLLQRRFLIAIYFFICVSETTSFCLYLLS